MSHKEDDGGYSPNIVNMDDILTEAGQALREDMSEANFMYLSPELLKFVHYI